MNREGSSLRTVLVLVVALLMAFALAQSETGKPLVIGNAQLRASYPGSPNVSYAPLTDLVRVLGLEWQVSSDAVTLSQGGRVVRITLAPSAADGSYYGRALSVNGEGRRGQAAGLAADDSTAESASE